MINDIIYNKEWKQYSVYLEDNLYVPTPAKP